jgi:hypothetical protein
VSVSGQPLSVHATQGFAFFSAVANRDLHSNFG